MLEFIIWAAVGVIIFGIGIFSFFSKKPVGFWANAKMFDVEDCKKYNYAVGKLFCIFGVIFIVLGLPLLGGQNSSLVIISVLGVMMESIISMVVYTLAIERKYRKKK